MDEGTNELTRVTLATVIFVATKLQQDRVVFLPHAVTFFLTLTAMLQRTFWR